MVTTADKRTAQRCTSADCWRQSWRQSSGCPAAGRKLAPPDEAENLKDTEDAIDLCNARTLYHRSLED